ncbi:MAG: T9SS type A sorting domain-containing protein [Elusimicrobiota bacterium]
MKNNTCHKILLIAIMFVVFLPILSVAVLVEINNINITSIKMDSATIEWDSTIIGSSQIEYGTSLSYGSITNEEPLSYFHISEVKGLTAGETYHFRIKTKNYSGEETVSADYSFTTLTETGMEEKVRAARSKHDLPKIYYVKSDGDDAKDGFTIATAWQHLSQAAQIAEAGDLIYLIDDPSDPNDGIWYDERVVAYNSGIDTHPITIKAFNGTPTFVATGSNIRNPDVHLISFHNWGEPGPISYWNIEGLKIEKYNKAVHIYRESHHINVTNVRFEDCFSGFWAGRESHHLITKDLQINNSWWNAWCVWTRTHHIMAINVRVTNQIEHSFFDIHSGDDDTPTGNDYISLINCSAEGSTVSTTAPVYMGHGPDGTYDDYVAIINFTCKNVPLREMFEIWTPGAGLYIDGVNSANVKEIRIMGSGSNLVMRNVLLNISDSDISHGVYFSAIGNLKDVLLENIRVNGVNRPYCYDFDFESGFDKIHNVTMRNPAGDNNDVSIVVPAGVPMNDYKIEFTNGKVFTATYNNTVPRYYPDRSVIQINVTGGNKITLYPMIARPVDGYATIAINKFDTSLTKGDILVDFTVDTTEDNKVEFVVGELKADANYQIKRSSANYLVVKSNANRCLLFSNSDWAAKAFTIQETDLSSDITTPPEVGLEAAVSSAPENLAATGQESRIVLFWRPPLTAGGSPITNHKIYRGLFSGGETFLDTIGAELAYTDTTVDNDVVHYYQVSALNKIGEGPKSNECNFRINTPVFGSEDVSKIKVYPNPYVKGKSSGEKISFAGLPDESTIRIYEVSGELIETIEHNDGDKEDWNIPAITSGIYLYSINSSQGNKQGKISIVK